MGLTSTIKDFFSPLPKKKVDFRPSSFIIKKKDIIDVISKDPPSVPSLPSGVISSGFTPNTLRDAINDAKAARATALANARGIMDNAFINNHHNTASLFKSGYKISLFDEFFDSHGNPIPASIMPKAPIDDDEKDEDGLFKVSPLGGVSRAVDPQPKIRTGKIARIELDVIIGPPQISKQTHSIKNSLDKELYFDSNHKVVLAAVQRFNEKLNEMYCGKTPLFTIESGTMFRTGFDDSHPNLDFNGLKFDNGSKITALFSYGESNKMADIIEVRKQLELVGRTCEFFILGEMELDEDEETLTEMVIECFGYFNQHRANINKELFRIL